MKKKNAGFYGGAKSYVSDQRSEVEKDISEKAETYGRMSEEKLLDELFAEAAAARRRGDLDDGKLRTFYDSVKGALSPDQLRKLDILMRALTKG